MIITTATFSALAIALTVHSRCMPIKNGQMALSEWPPAAVASHH